MKKKTVKIPNVEEEVRIGYSFNYMIKVIAETETADVVLWDFADVTFLHPFFLAPLAIYKNTSGKHSTATRMVLTTISIFGTSSVGMAPSSSCVFQ